MKQRKLTIKNTYIVLSVFLPVLSIYASPIQGVDFGTLCVLLFAMFMMFNKASIRMPWLLSLLLLYSLLGIVPVMVGITTEYSSVDTVVLRLMRFIIVMVIMVGFGYSTYYDEEKFIKVLRFLSIIVASYAILQAIVFNVAGIKLRNIFGPERGGAIFTSAPREYESVYRPPSIFLEPSSVTYFLTPFLCYILFRQKKVNKRDLYLAVLISLGIVVSTSGQGLMVLALCWGIWLFSQMRKMNFSSIILAAVFAVILYYNYDFSYSMTRITTTDEMNAIDARAGGYELVRQMPVSDLLFGSGFGNYVETIYYSSLAEIVFCTGYVGLVIILCFYLSLFIKGARYQKVLVLASVLLMTGGGVYTATYLCLYLPLLLQQYSPPNSRYNIA